MLSSRQFAASQYSPDVLGTDSNVDEQQSKAVVVVNQFVPDALGQSTFGYIYLAILRFDDHLFVLFLELFLIGRFERLHSFVHFRGGLVVDRSYGEQDRLVDRELADGRMPGERVQFGYMHIADQFAVIGRSSELMENDPGNHFHVCVAKALRLLFLKDIDVHSYPAEVRPMLLANDWQVEDRVNDRWIDK